MTACTVILPSVAAVSWSRVETASPGQARAERAMRESAASGASTPRSRRCASATGRARCSRGRENKKVWQRDRTVRSIFDASVVQKTKTRWARRLLDQLEERVEGSIRELVRLVEDVDLVAPLDRLQDDTFANLTDVVDPTLEAASISMTSSDVPAETAVQAGRGSRPGREWAPARS